jgi:putative Holliday junction resolvase
MKILGIDYGRRKVGLAIGIGSFAEPFRVFRYKDIKILGEQIKQVVEEEKIDRVIVGISEGEMGEESKDFGLSLGKTLSIPVETFDETLTSQDAQRLSREAGISRKKRRGMEDAYAACLMLQNYLDSNFLA